ncbi:MAG: aminoglycoside phosphotransferase family protein [Clostridia bacterium]|nr:aminoglycoside phosphotransferase family protein [Clostridia bacterium]
MGFNLKEVCEKFSIETEIESYGNGHINDTYMANAKPQIILQRINKNVFHNPHEVMENIYNVTEHLKKKIIERGGDPKREALNVVKTRDGQNYLQMDADNFFRMYLFVTDSVSYDVAQDPIQLFHAGAAFGRFQNMLNDYPADSLYETIVDFHNTPERVKQLETAIAGNASGRLDLVKEEVDFAIEYAKYSKMITDEMAKGTVPLRVTHNDTKLNNVLFDAKTGEGVCVIDLDTVMPGSILYDFGDALRFGASSGAEDEKDLDRIWFDLEKFEQFAKGFLGEVKDCLTPKEIELLPVSALIMTYECGIRFLADHINGDVYFKVHRENHNLDRARTQFKLVADIESKFDEMKRIIEKYL